jgi:hypothetical protein
MESKKKILGQNVARLYNIDIGDENRFGSPVSEAPEPVGKVAPVA